MRAITAEAHRSQDGRETGGILLGFDSNGALAITEAGGPGPGAVRTRRTFRRDLGHAQRLADLAWRRDGAQWVGEWHTHPSGDLEPSVLDLRSYQRHLHDPELNLHRFVALIVGVRALAPIKAALWVVERTHFSLTPFIVEPPRAR